MKKSLLLSSLVVIFLVQAQELDEALIQTKIISVWEGVKMPGIASENLEQQKPDRGDGVIRITNVVVCPGGGYRILAYNKCGTDIAQWLNSLGYHAAVLKYRVPNNRQGALQDIQRAIRKVRHHSDDWGFNSDKIGVIGFSAGGHLVANASNNFDVPSYEKLDNIDEFSCRPDFTMLIYPAYLNKGEQIAPEFAKKINRPPSLIVHSQDDKPYVPGTLLYVEKLKQDQADYKFLYYKTGGHGYGLYSTKEAKAWPQQAAEWLAALLGF